MNSHRTGLEHKHVCRFIALGHKYDRHDVMWKHTIDPNGRCSVSWLVYLEAAGYSLLLRFLIWDKDTKWTKEITQLNYWMRFRRKVCLITEVFKIGAIVTFGYAAPCFVPSSEDMKQKFSNKKSGNSNWLKELTMKD